MTQLYDKIRTLPALQFGVFLILSLLLVWISQAFGLAIGVIILSVILAAFTGVAIYLRPLYGLHVIITVAFFLFLVQRMFKVYDVPLGVIIEVTTLVTLLILLTKKSLGGIRNLVSYLVLGWLSLNAIEFLNPMAASRLAWVYAFRGVLNITFIYFVAYSVIRSKQDILSIVRYWIFLSLIAALYCLYQEYYGFPSFDMAWINSSEERYNLLFTWGRLRKFSFFSGPTELGLVLTYALLMTFVLIFVYSAFYLRLLLFAVAGIMLLALIQTGSRTSTILLPIGLAIFTIITLKKEVIITMGALFFVGVLAVLAPTRNASLFVMRTAFETSEDPSYNVRLINQQKINPYILSSPFGYGLGSTGDWGRKFSPNTFVGSFPPDSEYVKIAIETGWMGLIIWAAILFLIFRFSIKQFFVIRDQRLRMIYSIFVCIFYMYLVAQYPQEAFRVPSTTILFGLTLGIIAKIRQIEHPEIANKKP